MKRLAFALLVLLFAIPLHADPITVFNGNGILTGVQNLPVNGTFYDVTFNDDNGCILQTTPATFGCNVDSFDYSLDYPTGMVAMQALIDTILRPGVYAPNDINSCTWLSLCRVYLPVLRPDLAGGVGLLGIPMSDDSEYSYKLQLFSLRLINCCDLEGIVQSSTFVKFTPSVGIVDTPEPSMGVLMVVALTVAFLIFQGHTLSRSRVGLKQHLSDPDGDR